MVPQTLRLRFTVNEMYNILYKKYLQQDMLLLLHMVVDRARDDFFVVTFRIFNVEVFYHRLTTVISNTSTSTSCSVFTHAVISGKGYSSLPTKLYY